MVFGNCPRNAGDASEDRRWSFTSWTSKSIWCPMHEPVIDCSSYIIHRHGNQSSMTVSTALYLSLPSFIFFSASLIPSRLNGNFSTIGFTLCLTANSNICLKISFEPPVLALNDKSLRRNGKNGNVASPSDTVSG
jgi:hypothetical protein